MSWDEITNFGKSEVTVAPSPATSGLTLEVADGDELKGDADPPFNVTIWPFNSEPRSANAEIARVTDITADVVTLDRAQEGTAARTIVVGDQIAQTETKKTFTDLQDAIDLLFSAGVVTTLFDETLVSSQASFDRTSIPTTSAHMLITAYLRGTTAATNIDTTLRFNNDSGSNYDYQSISASGTSVSAAQNQGGTSLQAGEAPASTGSANRFGLMFMWLPNYANTSNHKPILIFNGRYHGTTSGTGRLQGFFGLWRSTSAINRVTLAPTAGSWDTGSRFSGYGIG